MIPAEIGKRLPVAIVNNSVTPYRIDLHNRLVEELPELEIWSLFTHEVSNAPWRLEAPARIRPVFFGAGGQSLESDRLARQPDEWRKGGRILKWLKRHRIGAVVLGGYNDIGRLRILYSCYSEGLPCFLFGDSNIHCDRASGWKRALKGQILRSVLGLATGILCCGRFGEDYFRRYGVPRERLFRFPYEPDYKRLRTVCTKVVDRVRELYKIRADRQYLLYSGRLVKAKRVDLLLDAFSRIALQRPEWGLIIAGDGALLASLRQSVPDKIQERVIWTGFINDPDEVRALYTIAQALVLPSDYEPWGVVVTEAAVRIPVVASSVVGAAADVITDGVNGRVFESGDAGALARCLLDVTDQATLESMTAAAPRSFAAWHENSDPVRGLRAALRSATDANGS